jgi:hypothetical protein
MAQMPIQSLSGRAEPYAAASLAHAASRPRGAPPQAAYLYENNGIPGGRLRPGAVDQELFKAELAAAQKAGLVAAQPPVQPVANPPAFAGIPTLSPAQLAALGAVEEPPAGEVSIDIPATNPLAAGEGVGAHAPHLLPGQAGGIAGQPGAPAKPLFQAAPGAPAAELPAAASATPEAAVAPDGPTAGNSTHDDIPTAAVPAAEPPAPAAPASAERGPIPGARRGADGAWELTRLPDKDERDRLRGQAWRVVESERSRQLFLGPDGKFGWDDFIDLVNPLQHIPLVNIAYRAITGDEIYGAARLIDMAMGPMAGISTAIDLAVTDISGRSVADNAVAALFAPGDEPGSNPGVAVASINTASGTQLADAGLIRRGSNE